MVLISNHLDVELMLNVNDRTVEKCLMNIMLASHCDSNNLLVRIQFGSLRMLIELIME